MSPGIQGRKRPRLSGLARDWSKVTFWELGGPHKLLKKSTENTCAGLARRLRMLGSLGGTPVLECHGEKLGDLGKIARANQNITLLLLMGLMIRSE